jgi:hypothetical protein
MAAGTVMRSVRHARAGGHPVADGDPVDGGADLLDDADELVAEDDRPLHAAGRVPLLQRGHHRAGRVLGGVRAAQPHPHDPEPHVAGTRGRRLGTLLDAGVPRGVQDEGLHRVLRFSMCTLMFSPVCRAAA